jgi:alpha-tubulin suppressor-like RCC1 family protein
MIALDAEGGVWTWGKNGGGCLGLAGTVADNALVAQPAAVALPTGAAAVIAIGACNEISGALTSTGALFLWGASECSPCSTFGGISNRLGLGVSRGGKRPGADTDVATRVEGFDAPVVGFSLGSVYSAAWCDDGSLYTWGFGGFGNLGHGDRRSYAVPKKVAWFAARGVRIVQCSCTVGEANPKVSLLYTVTFYANLAHSLTRSP